MQPETAPVLHAYITWSLGIDQPGLAIVYAENVTDGHALLQNYCDKAQPKHRLHEVYLPLEIRRTPEDNAPNIYLYPIGLADPGTKPHVLIIDRGEDVRFDD